MSLLHQIIPFPAPAEKAKVKANTGYWQQSKAGPRELPHKRSSLKATPLPHLLNLEFQQQPHGACADVYVSCRKP